MDFNRVLLRFSKEGDASYLSHHDLMRLLERALRRAGLPVRMSQGFNPHPRMAVLQALPVGVEAADEPLLLDFEPPVAPEEVLRRLASQLPKGIGLRSARAMPVGAKPRVVALAYEVTLPGSAAERADVGGFLAREAIRVERVSPKRRRTLDVRPALEAMSLEGRRLRFRLRVGAEGTPKPTEVVAALVGDQAAASARYCRTKVELAAPSHAGRG